MKLIEAIANEKISRIDRDWKNLMAEQPISSACPIALGIGLTEAAFATGLAAGRVAAS